MISADKSDEEPKKGFDLVTEERKTAKNAALSPLLILEPLNLM
jgi:hypothetical protein